MNRKPGSVTKGRKPFVLEFDAAFLGTAFKNPSAFIPVGIYTAVIYLGLSLRRASLQSTRSFGRAARLLLDFAPDEVCRIFFGYAEKYQAGIVTNTAVGSYPAISPLPCHLKYRSIRYNIRLHRYFKWQGGIFSVALSVLPAKTALRICKADPIHTLAVRPGCYPASCPAEPGLSSHPAPGSLYRTGRWTRRQPGSSLLYSSSSIMILSSSSSSSS